MEAVAVSAINLGVKSAAIAITDEIGLLVGVQEELFFIKKEHEMMQAFLRAASTENVKGEVMTTWIQQVQELASDVDNCLQVASVLQMKKGCLLAMFFVKRRIARKIRVLKTRIEDVNKRYQRQKLKVKAKAEAELIQAVVLLFERLGIKSLDVGIRVIYRKVLQAVLQMYAIPENLFTQVCVIVDKRFRRIMHGIQGALIVASALQIIVGFSGLWRNVTRYLSPLSAVPLVALVGFMSLVFLGTFRRKSGDLSIELVRPMFKKLQNEAAKELRVSHTMLKICRIKGIWNGLILESERDSSDSE
ncbi:Histidyl-tRNA synthetase [Carex littledalei]|uniref:Histidyl-tRNA synthetase n=1 Tax=Carex littledalei TaxID=544730 RepID=A0A833RPH2_9POAL|nr:Histidyl-tRNA synthetase [Carex littledalei]